MKPTHSPANTGRRQLVLGAAVAAASPFLGMRSALAQSYPERPITFICPWPAGGTADQSMRALCQVAARVLGQAIAVENKAGASGMIGTKAMASAKPDGYTIGQIPISVTRFSQLGTLQLDPLKDLTYLARTSGQTFGIAAPATGKYKSLKEVVAQAKANPGTVTYAHAGVGGATHVGMEEFAMAAGIQFNHVPFKGGADALQAVLGGHVDLLADSSSWAPHVESGKLALLATWGEQRTARFKDTPTLKELGYNVVVDAPNGIGAPKGLDPAITKKLRDAFRQAVASPEFKQVVDRIDAPVLYLDGPDYEKYVATVYQKETALIEKLKLKELMKS
ncbi:MAG: tripartite tricarboxylate transporter substrate binding protein [Betaproteobacteria bacterium]|jgi:tripartite-type tricarboxylate transporter receptor subunit TctC|nr:tripartite tricarboxylate transporter substrate binding protein [Betaproteobacteria bacterium]MBP6647670.1 tripartite tricarboxylate transporter substrate binding protein [Burkholderiaceae bacterium]MBP8150138.1 tripartite tricarboxylate transporter substrate binding protein [Limnohabitans sp.]